MYKFLLFLMLILSINGCSNFTLNGSMCDNIGIGSQRGIQNIPQECKDYDEKKADEAFHKVVQEKKVSDKDIKFDKEEE
ncbi:hypothetical protein JHD46_04705 [Sulfurimonas sp. SAG-AH-194-C20]|nr:hypothetical protein [Sulfurimonas sp. SAG-AH-194-C20]MDF1878936.1 hypothetical protein [Sulfurimonas sp. SAG-AH-194-C20]